MEVMETEGKEAGHQDVYERHQDGVPLETMSIRQQANAHKKFQPKEQEMRDTYESLVRYVGHTLTDVVGLETIHGIPLIESDFAQLAPLFCCGCSYV